MNRSIIAILALAAVAAFAATPASALEGKWMSGDFHQHSYVTDGSYPTSHVLDQGFSFGLDWQANSEHGGSSDEAGDDPRRSWSFLAPEEFLGDYAGSNRIWRWQSLLEGDKVPAYLETARINNPGKLVISGLEMNMPGAEHCSTAIVADVPYAMAQFEYLFDRSDNDTTGGLAMGFEDAANNGVAKNHTDDTVKAEQSAAWMQENYAGYGWMVPAHPERAADLDWTDGNPSAYGPRFFRAMNDAGPDVFFGFESAPGHQKSSSRGGISTSKFGGTYGGVGYFAAKVGGLWDALLGEGRDFWLFHSSDFHSTGGDFWPGEYQKTYSYVEDVNSNEEYDAVDIVASLRSGNSFIVFGDLINELKFTAKDRIRGTEATMGETLEIRRNGMIEVTVRFKSPATNYNGDVPAVNFVQLIAGEVTGKLTPEMPEYGTQGENPTTEVVAAYLPTDMTVDQDGYTVCTYQVRRMKKDMYFRVRGTNQLPGTAYETDAEGNPLADSEAGNLGLNGADEAWADLWFYSNPIFVDVK